jgi:hypothetical protein
MKAVIDPAAMSSAIIPTPPATSLSIFPIRKGFNISRIRNITRPYRTSIDLAGREIKEINIPTTSSITTRDGSLPQIFSICEELATPTPVSRATTIRYQNKEIPLIKKNKGRLATEATVPGAFGA